MDRAGRGSSPQGSGRDASGPARPRWARRRFRFGGAEIGPPTYRTAAHPEGRSRAYATAITMSLAVTGCTCASEPDGAAPTGSSRPVAVASAPNRPLPQVLYLPDGGSSATAAALPSVAAPAVAPEGRCPADMVDVGGRFCIDRYEAVLEDRSSGLRLSPYYHPTAGQTRRSYERWLNLAESTGPAQARRIPVPPPPPFQLTTTVEPTARSLPGVLPNGYLSRHVAEAACYNAGKRLCSSEEWVVACKGYAAMRFPYGPVYEHGRCNVFRDTHPAGLLHGDPSHGHLDPRLNLVGEGDRPLLRPTGDTPECRSNWGADAVFDMVGNLDEWVSDPGGVFVGGFYSRATRNGCDARVEAHPPEYFDYSLGVRCCL